MNKNFWIQFAISEGAALAEAALAAETMTKGTLTAAQIKALQDVVSAAAEVTTAFAG